MIDVQHTDEPIITLTERAIIAVKEFLDDPSIEGDGLRVFVKGGGCAGFEHGLDFSKAQDGDFLMIFDGLRVYVDPISATLLEGTTIDFTMGLMGAGFKFSNPGASRTCGCGSSFA